MRRPALLFALLLSLLVVLPTGAHPLLQTAPDTTETADEKKAKKDLPLEPTRTFAMTATEGSWLSVDVSPDGQTLVFDLLGDLYLLPIDGGAARRLTEGMAFDSQPRFSPDGTRLVFTSDRSGATNVWTIGVNGEDAEALTEGKTDRYESPAWSPDGKYVAVSKGEGRFGVTKLWLLHADGGSGAGLIKEPETRRTLGAAFSPDGRYLWYAQRTGTWQYNAQLPQYQLGMYDRDTGETYARSSRQGSAFRPTLSPDGRWLVYGTRHEADTGLRLRDLATGAERWLAYPVQRDDQESVASRDVLPGMAFTPDSEALVASYGGKLWRIPVAGGDAQPIPFTVDVEVGLGPELAFDYPIEDTPTFTVRQIRDAVPSPDGRRLAFTALDRLYVMDGPGATPRRLTELDATEAQPTWSPDGRWIAFATWRDDGGHLYRVRADGQGTPQRLTTAAALYQQPAWSPDGARIAAVRGPARAYQESTGPRAAGAVDDLVWIPAAGGAATVIAPAEGRAHPHFTDRPGRVYLFHDEKGLVSIRWDGTDEKAHVKVVGNTRPGQKKPNDASLILMAPRGDQALARVNSDLYVVTVPYVGGETPTISVAKPEGAAFPARKLTDIGGEFPAWSADAKTVHWSMGNAHAVYDLDAARAWDAQMKAKKKAEKESEKKDEDEKTERETEEKKEEKKEETFQAAETRIVIEAPRDLPRGAVVLRGARLVTMNGDEVIEDGDLVVRDNRIVALGARGTVEVPAGAQVIDVSGKTIVPGFVDAHAHMWPAWDLHKPQSWLYLANLAYGVTTTRDPQTSSSDVLTYGDLVRAGRMIGPRVYSTGRGVFGDYQEDPLRDLDHARDVLRRYSDYYDTKTIKMYMAGNRQQRQWVVMAAREQGLMPTTEGGLDMGYNVTMLLDGYPGQEHSFPVYPLYADVIRLTAEAKMAYTPTLLVSYGGPFAENYFFSRENPHDDPKLRRFTPHDELDGLTRRRGAGWFRDDEHVFRKHAEVANAIVAAGGRVGVGSHGQLQGLGYHWELWALGSGGMRNHDALRAATVMGAEALGLDDDLGALRPGLLADLVVLDANPLDDLRHTNTVRYVMKNGRLYEGSTLDEVWPRQRALPAQPWQEADPVGVPGIR